MDKFFDFNHDGKLDIFEQMDEFMAFNYVTTGKFFPEDHDCNEDGLLNEDDHLDEDGLLNEDE